MTEPDEINSANATLNCNINGAEVDTTKIAATDECRNVSEVHSSDIIIQKYTRMYIAKKKVNYMREGAYH